MGSLGHCGNVLSLIGLRAWIFDNLEIRAKRLAHLGNIGGIDALRKFWGIIPIQSI
jgi:hypothetical protein